MTEPSAPTLGTWPPTVPAAGQRSDPAAGQRSDAAAALAKAATLIEALPWLDSFHGQTVGIKYGGHAINETERRHHYSPT